MKPEKLMTLLWSSVLSFLLSFGAVACVVSGFSMMVDLGVVAVWCAFASIGFSICYLLPLGLVPIAAFSLISGLMWNNGDLENGLESLLYRITRQYDRGYKWGVIQLNHLTPQAMESSLIVGLTMIGVLIALLASWAICRRKTALPGASISLILLASCLVVTDTVPETPWLVCLFFGVIMLLFTHTVRRQDETRGNKLSTVLVLPALILLLGLFFLLPEAEYTGDEFPRRMFNTAKENNEVIAHFFGETVEVGTTGSSVDSGTVNLRSVGIRLPSQAEILQMLTDYDDTIYLRGRALDQYDGLTWTDSGTPAPELYWPESSKLGEGGEVMITTRYAHRMLYLPYYVQSKDLTDVTRGMENKGKLNQYSFTCKILDLQNEQFLLAVEAPYDPAEWETEFAKHIHLSDEVLAWAKPLAESITEGETTVYGKANAIANYVRNAARYDTNTKRMPTDATDFAKWFLETSETGYCVHYATATTVLLQAIGIPARYVTGYMADMQAAYLKIVQSKDAHAWAEYWLPGYGWMVLESTAPDLRGQEETTQPTEAPAVGTPQSPNGTPAVIPGRTDVIVTPGVQPTEPSQETQTTSPEDTAPQEQPLKLTWLIPVALTTAGGVCLLITQWKLRVYARQKRCCKGTQNQRALSLWRELERMHRYLDAPPAESIRELAEKAKFSPHTLTEEELTCIRSALCDAKQALRAKPRLRRLWYRLILALY